MSLFARLRHEVLDAPTPDQGWLGRTAIFVIRLALAIVRKFQDEQLHLRSTSLAYTTLLSLVPFLAVTFSVLKGFGVQNQLKPMLMGSLEPLGAQGAEIGQYILNYVDNLNFAVLGFLGIAVLFWTVISLLTKVEEAFNAIWHVPGMRTLGRRFSDYLSVALVGPVFFVSALGITTVTLSDANVHRIIAIEPLGQLAVWLGELIPHVLIWVAFAFLYAFLTNCRVRVLPALIGGIFASAAWYGVGDLFSNLVASSSRYSAIYTSLAAAVLFIIWINIGWLIILVGAHIARYLQYPHLLNFGGNGTALRQVHDETLALQVMVLIAHTYYFDEPKWTLETLAARGCCGSPDQIERLLQSLKDHHLIVATDDQPAAYLPARSIETIPLGQIVASARPPAVKSTERTAVQQVVDQIDNAVLESLEGKTLRDLVLAQNEPTTPKIPV